MRVTDDAAQVMTIAIYDKKGFQMIDTKHTEVVLQEKPRAFFDKAAGKRGKKMVPITNSQNLYNTIMGFVDLDDLLAWFYGCLRSSSRKPTHTPHSLRHIHRCHNFREFKYWVPVYIWIVRKRADQAFKAYVIRYNEELEAAKSKLAASTKKRSVDINQVELLNADITKLVRGKVLHFDFLEDVVGYHIIMVHFYTHPRMHTSPIAHPPVLIV